MAGFQAVDLDSILDEFESKQSETEKEDRPGKVEIPIKDTYNTETWSSHQLDINITTCTLCQQIHFLQQLLYTWVKSDDKGRTDFKK